MVAVRWMGILIPVVVLGLTGCGGGGGSGGPPSTAPTVVVLEPSTNTEIGLAAPVPLTIVYQAQGPGTAATTDVYADVDGDAATTDDQYLLAQNLPGFTGQVQSYTWDPTSTSVPPGTYWILAIAKDTSNFVVAQSAGAVTLNGQPTMDIASPSGVFVTTRGGKATVRFTADDADDAAIVWFQLDHDGDLTTTDDTYVVSPWIPEDDGVEREIRIDLTGVPLDSYTLFGMVWDGTNPITAVAAPASVRIFNMAYALAQETTPRDVAHRPDGSTLVAGTFRGAQTFGLGDASETTLDTGSFGSINGYLARYLWNGRLSWVKRLGRSGDSVFPTALASQPDGSAVVSGLFSGSATLGAGETNQTTLTSAGALDAFVARLDANGLLVWAQSAGGIDDEVAADVDVFPDGSCVTTGSSKSTSMTFNAGERSETTLTPSGTESDVYVARYNADGSLAWARLATGTGRDEPAGVASFRDGTCVVVGHYRESLTLGAGEANETTLTSVGNADTFLARYRSSGDLVHARTMGGARDDTPAAVGALSDGSCVIAGNYAESITFAADTANPITRTSTGPADANVFVVRYDATGAYVNARAAGSLGNDQVYDLAVHADDTFSITGQYPLAAIFGFGEARQTNLTVGLGTSAAFLATYDPDCKLIWAKTTHNSADDAFASGRKLATRPGGAIEMIGVFFNEATFGYLDPKQTTITLPPAAPSFSAYFLAVFNADGDF